MLFPLLQLSLQISLLILVLSLPLISCLNPSIAYLPLQVSSINTDTDASDDIEVPIPALGAQLDLSCLWRIDINRDVRRIARSIR